MATVGLFSDRVRQALQQEATSLLGADLRLTSTRAISPEYRAAALARNLRVVENAVFPSMISRTQAGRAGVQNQLAEVMAVEAGYPLRGTIEIDDGAIHVAQAVPLPGTLWADARLVQRMGLQIGGRGLDA